MAWVAPVVAAGASVIGDMMSSMSAQSVNQKTMNFDAQMQANQQAFAQSMFNQQEAANASAVQTRMADIKKAGLNPALAVGFGGAPAAGVPQAGGISSPTASLQNPGQAYQNLGGQVSSAAQLATLQSQKDQIDSSARANDAQARLAQSNADNVDARNVFAAKEAEAEWNKTKAEIDNLNSQWNNLEMEWNVKSNDSYRSFMAGKTADQSYQFNSEMQPLLLEQQRLQNKLTNLGISPEQNRAHFSSSPIGQFFQGDLGVGDPSGVVGNMADRFGQNFRSIGSGGTAAQQSLNRVRIYEYGGRSPPSQ